MPKGAMAECRGRLRHRPVLSLIYRVRVTSSSPAPPHAQSPRLQAARLSERMTISTSRASAAPPSASRSASGPSVRAAPEAGKFHHALAGGGCQLVGQLQRRGLTATGRDLREQLFEALREQV